MLPSGPCVPEHVQSFTHCENNLGAVSWAESDGAESYTAIAVGQDGHTHMCATNTTTCTWDDLHCGEQYTVHVIANDYLCSSMPSNSTSIRMGKLALCYTVCHQHSTTLSCLKHKIIKSFGREFQRTCITKMNKV